MLFQLTENEGQNKKFFFFFSLFAIAMLWNILEFGETNA